MPGVLVQPHESSKQGMVCALLRARQDRATLYALTAAHVLALDGRAQVRDRSLMGTEGRLNLVGSLQDWIPRDGPHPLRAGLEAALVAVDADTALSVDALLGPRPTGIAEAGIAGRLIIQGRAGPVASIGAVQTGQQVRQTDRDQTFVLDLDDVLCWTHEALEGFGAGDSGAPVLDEAGRLVAMYVGEGSAADGTLAIGIPIRRILDWAQADLLVAGEPLAPPRPPAPIPLPQPPSREVPTTPAPSLPASPAPPAARPDLADILARTAWGAAGGTTGTTALRTCIAHLVLNRIDLDKPYLGGQDIVAVCRKPFQFGCWQIEHPEHSAVMAMTPESPDLREALLLARTVIALPATLRRETDPTRGATHLHRLDEPPAWTHGLTVLHHEGGFAFTAPLA